MRNSGTTIVAYMAIALAGFALGRTRANREQIVQLIKADAAPRQRSEDATSAPAKGHGGPIKHARVSLRVSDKAAALRSPSTSGRCRLLCAIEQKEGWDGARHPGPAGERGPYQITREYWQDACAWGKLDWNYDTHVWSRDRCEYVMEMYWRRHGAKTDEQRARMNNGGPDGPWRHSTEQYWNDVKNLMTTYKEQ